MKVYVIQIWDHGEKHLTGVGFLSERLAKEHCEKDEWLEYDDVEIFEPKAD